MCEALCRLVRRKFRQWMKLLRMYELMRLMKMYQLTQVLTQANVKRVRPVQVPKYPMLNLATRSLRRQLIP